MTDPNLVQRDSTLVPIHLAADTHSIKAFRTRAFLMCLDRQCGRSAGERVRTLGRSNRTAPRLLKASFPPVARIGWVGDPHKGATPLTFV